MFVYFTVCYFAGIFYAVVSQISMLFIDNKDSVFCILYSVYMYYFREVVTFDNFFILEEMLENAVKHSEFEYTRE